MAGGADLCCCGLRCCQHGPGLEMAVVRGHQRLESWAPDQRRLSAGCPLRSFHPGVAALPPVDRCPIPLLLCPCLHQGRERFNHIKGRASRPPRMCAMSKEFVAPVSTWREAPLAPSKVDFGLLLCRSPGSGWCSMGSPWNRSLDFIRVAWQPPEGTQSDGLGTSDCSRR